MRISNRIGLGLFVLAGAIVGPVAADRVVLTEESRLTGDVRGINAAGVVELASPLSTGPILLNADAMEKIEFTQPSAGPDVPEALLELVTGDLLPARLERMDDANLTVVTADAGTLTIPRTALKSLQLGVHKHHLIYAGPNNIAEWTEAVEVSKGWKFVNEGLVASGNAVAARNFDLPRKFVLKFTLKWQANPNFQITFADPLTTKMNVVDRYVLLFTAAGFEIRREATKGNKRVQPIILPVRGADQFPSRQVAVEIRVDRKTSKIHLLLDGEPEAAGADPGLDPPSGGGMILSCKGPPGPTLEILGIEVAELDDSSTRHHSEDRGDPKTDSLISRDDDRWGGRLTSIHSGPNGVLFSFKSDFQDQPLELSEADVSTVFFAKSDPAADEKPERRFVLKLGGEGLLKVSSCELDGANFIVTHPLLGKLKIARKGVVALENPKNQAVKGVAR